MQHIAQMWEQQITKNPFIPRPIPIFKSKFKTARPVRRSTSSPHILPSQISKSSQIKAACLTQQTNMTSSPELTQETEVENQSHSSPFSVSGTDHN